MVVNGIFDLEGVIVDGKPSGTVSIFARTSSIDDERNQLTIGVGYTTNLTLTFLLDDCTSG